MSWDVVIFRPPPQVTTLDELPAGFEPPPLGAMTDVLARLRDTLPALDLTEPDWGRLAGPTWTMELGIGAEDPVATVTLFIRGTGDDVLDAIDAIATALGARAAATETGTFVDDDPSGWHAFQRDRDRILRPPTG